MVDIGIQVKLEGLSNILAQTRQLFQKMAGLSDQAADAKGTREQERQLDIQKEILATRLKISKIKVGPDPREKNLSLGPQFSTTLKGDIALELKKIQQAEGEAAADIGKFDQAIRAQNFVMQDAITTFKVFNQKVVEGKGSLSQKAGDFKNLSASITSSIAILRRYIAENEKLGDTSKKSVAEQRKQLALLERLQSVVQGNQRALAETAATQRKYAKAQEDGNKATHDLNERIGIAIGKLLRYRIAFFLLRGAIDSVRSSITEFINLQDKFAQLNKVLDPILSSMSELKKVGFEFAKAYSVSIDEVIDSFTKWAQTGLTQNEIIDATRATLLAVNATNIKATEIIEALTSAIASYNVEAKDATDIVDKWIAVQAKFPVTSEDLLRGLQTIGNLANEFGVSIDELNGQISAISEVTRKTGKAVAESLKTILARIPRKETVKVFQDIGVQVVAAGGQFREFDKIIEDLAAKWKDLTEAQRINISLTIGGVRRYGDFVALIENFSRVQEATAVSLGSTGAATRAASIQIATLKSTIEKTKASFAALGFTIGEELSKPLRFFLGIFRDLADAFLAFGPAVTKTIAAIITFSTTFITGLIAAKAFTFSMAFLGRQLGITNRKLQEQTLSLKLVDTAGKQVAVALTGVATAEGAVAVGANAAKIATTGLLSAFNIILGVLSLLATAYSLLTFKNKEYQILIDNTAKSLSDQADRLFENQRGLVEQEKIIKEALESRKSILEELSKLEGTTDAEEIAKKKVLASALESKNAVIANQNAEARALLEDEANKSVEKQIALNDRLGQIYESSIVPGLRERSALYQAEFEILKKQRPQLEANLQKNKESRSQLLELSKNSVGFFVRSTQAALEFADAASKVDFITVADGIKEANKQARTFAGDVPKQFVAELKVKGIKEAEEKLKPFLDETDSAIQAFDSDVANFLERIKRTGLDNTIFTEIFNQLDQLSTNNKAALQSAKEAISSFAAESSKGGIAAAEALERVNNAVAFLNSVLFDSAQIASKFLSPALAALGDKIRADELSLMKLNIPTVVDGANTLAGAMKEAQGETAKFFGKDVSLQFIESFEKIRLAVKDTAKNIREDFDLKGIQRDTEKATQAMQNSFLTQLNNLRNLSQSLEADITKTAEEIQISLDRAERSTLEEDKTDFKNQANELQERLNNLLAQQIVLQSLSPKLEALLVNKIQKVNEVLAQQIALEQDRNNTLSNIGFFYDSQARLAEAVGARQSEILKIERAKIAALAKERISQLRLVEDNETVAKIMAVTNKAMIDLAQNAQEVSLEHVRRDLEAINSLSESFKGDLAAAFSGINTDIIKGIEKRFEISEEVKEAEFQLQEAIRKGDDNAVNSAKQRVAELTKELKTFNSILFEINEFGRRLFEGLGDSINQALSQKFADDIIELAVDDSTLGQKVARAILGVNKTHESNLASLYQAQIQGIAGVDRAFLADLGILFKDATQEMHDKILEAIAGDDTINKYKATLNEAAYFMGEKTKEGIIDGILLSQGITPTPRIPTPLPDEEVFDDLTPGVLAIPDTVKESGRSIAQAVDNSTAAIDGVAQAVYKGDVTIKDALNSGLQFLASTLAGIIGTKFGGGSASAQAGGTLGGLGGQAIGKSIGSVGGPIGFLVGSVVGGLIGGLFGGKKETKQFVPSIQENTDALRANTLAIEQLQKNVINAPSNFVIPGFTPAAQGPAPQFNITVSGVSDGDQFVEQVINRISRDYQRGTRTGTTRRFAL